MNSNHTMPISGLLAVAIGLGAFSLGASAQVKVGDTKDGCGAEHNVTFHGKDGKVTVKAGKTVTADLPAPTREIMWQCGGSKERSSNDEPYDRVQVKRAGNGAITWIFFRKQADAASGQPAIATQTGDTADACDGSRLVTFQGKNGTVTVKASQTVVADLPAPTKEIQFFCGGTRERAANDNPFDQVRVARSGNGAIRFLFLLKTAAADPASVCNKVHAFGRFFFKDENGVSTPLARVQVKLMDEDFGPTDQEMARGFTDKDGRFDLTGSASDSNCVGAGCKRPDPYVEFVLEQDHRVDVRDPLGNSARQQTKTQENTCGDVNFHRQEWSAAELDPILYFRAQRAYQKFNDLTGDTRVPGNEGTVGVEYPTVLIWNTPYTTWDTIHWQWHGDAMTNYDALDHEFGHRLRHGADGDTDHFNWDAMRFRYARNHAFADVTNEGFAFNEGWAEFHKTLIHHGLNGTWNGPVGDNVEGDVANQLFNLANQCGGFPALWKTMKGAGPNAFHSIDEYRAEFMRRNPLCGARVGTPLPGSAKVAPTPADSGMKKPLSASRAPGAARPTPLPEPQRADPTLRAALKGRMAAIEKQNTLAPGVARLRIPADLPAASHSAIERLNSRRAALAGTLHSETVTAYGKAIESLKTTPESFSDGTYEAARRAAQDAFAASVIAARLRTLEAARNDLTAEKAKTADTHLIGYLDRENDRHARAEADLQKRLTSRLPGSKLPADLLPKSFWGTTESKPD